MTALTADDGGFRLAIAADPADALARDAYLDWLCERADDGDESARVRAEFIRVQTELANFPRCERSHFASEHEGGQCVACQKACGPLRQRSRDLLAAHETTWRRAGACPKCSGDGTLLRGGRGNGNYYHPPYTVSCESCHGSGDVGGLADIGVPWAGDPSGQRHAARRVVEWQRGHVSGVACSLGEVLSRNLSAANSQLTGLVEPAPTAWAKAVCRWFPVTEFRVSDRVPYHNGYGHSWFDPRRERFSPSVPESANLPGVVFDALEACEGSYFVDGRFKGYPARELADSALARAMAVVARAAGEGVRA